VVDEVITSITREKWVRPLQNAKNPIDALVCMVQSISLKPEDLQRLSAEYPVLRDVTP
jgi:hypothetical protein